MDLHNDIHVILGIRDVNHKNWSYSAIVME
jgi:hypothetical protein